MFYSNSIANTVSAINVGYISKHRHVIVPTNVECIKILQKFVELGVVESFFTYRVGICLHAKITLSYIDGARGVNGVKFVHKKAKRYAISAKTALVLSKSVWSVIILSTSFGLLTAAEAADRGIGGLIYVVISK